jgi:hypothetical protein
MGRQVAGSATWHELADAPDELDRLDPDAVVGVLGDGWHDGLPAGGVRFVGRVSWAVILYVDDGGVRRAGAGQKRLRRAPNSIGIGSRLIALEHVALNVDEEQCCCHGAS